MSAERVVNLRTVVLQLGRIVATRGAINTVSAERVRACLTDHACGNWGVVCTEDKRRNDVAMVRGDRIMSAYAIDPGKPCAGFGANTFWIVTEADRRATTVLLPAEY